MVLGYSGYPENFGSERGALTMNPIDIEYVMACVECGINRAWPNYLCEECGEPVVNKENTMNPIDIECDGCNAEAGEPCREYCTGKAEWDENNE